MVQMTTLVKESSYKPAQVVDLDGLWIDEPNTMSVEHNIDFLYAAIEFNNHCEAT